MPQGLLSIYRLIGKEGDEKIVVSKSLLRRILDPSLGFYKVEDVEVEDLGWFRIRGAERGIYTLGEFVDALKKYEERTIKSAEERLNLQKGELERLRRSVGLIE